MNNQIAKKFDTLSLLKFTLPSMIMMLFMIQKYFIQIKI